ncbi:MAG: hypothetical protein ACJ8NR_05955 [Sulfurifustis sp.]
MKRPYVLLALVAAMLSVNVWYWWPSRSGVSADRRTAARWTPDLLRVKVALDTEKRAPLHRDLFHPKLAIVKAPPPPKPEPPPGPPPKTPEQLAEEAARAELTQIKLVGIVFRAEKGEAFLVKGDQAFIVHRGDKVGERFAVESVSADAVLLKDPATQVSGKITVSGR